MAPCKDTAATATFGDHEVITLENKLRNAVSLQPPVPGEEDPILRAVPRRSWYHGEAATFGFPAVAAATDSPCRLIEHTRDVTRIPISLVDQHVDAMRAIYWEYALSGAKELAWRLAKRLREVTNEFLIHENRDSPDVLEQIAGP